MGLSDAGLGTVMLKSIDDQGVVLRLSMNKDVFHISILKGDDKVITLVIEDDYEISQVISLLETCYDYA